MFSAIKIHKRIGKYGDNFINLLMMDNKTIIEGLSREFSIGREDVQALLSSFYTLVADSCIDGDKVVVAGFGQFESRKRKERVSVHPSTVRRLLVPPKLVMTFRASGLLKTGQKMEESYE